MDAMQYNEDVGELLGNLYEKGIRAHIDHGRVFYSGPAEVLCEKVLSRLRARENEVLTVLAESRALAGTGISRSAHKHNGLTWPSFQQQHLLNLQSVNSADNLPIPIALSLSGVLNVGCLLGAFETLVARYESLRTTIVYLNGVPRQKIAAKYSLDDLVVKIDATHSAVREGLPRRLVEELFCEEQRPGRDPLLQCRLIRVSESFNLFAVAIHHILADGYSLVRLFAEMWSYYGSLIRGEAPRFNDISLQYADYSVWQRKTHFWWLEAHEQYWKTRLSRASPVRFPVADRTEVCTVGVGIEEFSLDPEVSLELFRLVRRERVMPAILSVALYAALIVGWCRQTDFVIPFTIAGRDRSELKSVIGLFSQAILLRIELGGREKFSDLLGIASSEVEQAWKHMDCSRILELYPEMGRTYAQWISWTSEEIAGTCNGSDWNRGDYKLLTDPYLRGYQPPSLRVEWDVNVRFWSTGGRLHILGRYRADRFSAQTMRHVFQGLRTVAERVSDDASTRLDSFGKYFAKNAG